MSLADAAHALDELAAGQTPDPALAMRGLEAIDPLLLQGGRDQALRDAADLLELVVVRDGSLVTLAETRDRAAVMANAVRQVMGDAS